MDDGGYEVKVLKSLAAPFLGLLIALTLCSVLLLTLGEKPSILLESFQATFLSHFGLGYVLFYATPLIFTGLSVAVCFHCGLFNIGAEGQLYFGAISAVIFASLFPSLPKPIAIPATILVCALGGGLWGALAGYFKAKRGSHEVIVTILMNFIAIALVDYLILYPYKNFEIQNPETIAVPEAFRLSPLSYFTEKIGLDTFRTTPVNSAFFLAILAAFLVQHFLFKTTKGYELRAVGLQPKASRFAGISVTQNTLLAFAIAGGLAGLVGVNEVMGYQHKVTEGFSPGYGFTGIAVALLARNHPIGIIFSAILFGALQNSAREMEFLSEKVTKEMSLVLQAVLIAFISGKAILELIKRERRHA